MFLFLGYYWYDLKIRLVFIKKCFLFLRNWAGTFLFLIHCRSLRYWWLPIACKKIKCISKFNYVIFLLCFLTNRWRLDIHKDFFALKVRFNFFCVNCQTLTVPSIRQTPIHCFLVNVRLIKLNLFDLILIVDLEKLLKTAVAPTGTARTLVVWSDDPREEVDGCGLSNI